MITSAAELEAFEAAARAGKLGDEDREPEVSPDLWQDVGGAACINGVQVRGGNGVRKVAVQRVSMAPCQRCKQHKIEMPMVLFTRFEHRLSGGHGRLMFWFGPRPGSFWGAGYCNDCTQRLERHA